MSEYTDLLPQPITGTSGRLAGYLNWRFVVQIARAQSDAVLGTMVLGQDALQTLQWADVTEDCHGITVTRGAEAGSRPGAGRLSFWLDNESGEYDPTTSIYNGPGTLVRIFLGPPGTATPLVTTLTVSWNEATAAIGRSRWVSVVAYETITLLNEVNNPALSPVGAGETTLARMSRIMDEADWQFGLDIAYDGMPGASGPWWGWGLQETTLAGDLLTEAYRAVDSTGLVLRSARNGALFVCERDLGFVAGSESIGWNVPVVADSITTANDDDRLIGQVAVSRVGGSLVTYYGTGIAGRYQKRSTQRTDLITEAQAGNVDLKRYADLVLAQGKQTYRVESLELQSADGAPVWELVNAMDVGTRCNVISQRTATSGVAFFDYIICGFTITIEPLNENTINFTATLQTDVADSTSSYSTFGATWDVSTWDNGKW